MPALKRKRPNKQHNARGASFMRIAKELRVRATNGKTVDKIFGPCRAATLREIADTFAAEAKLLRSMR